MNGHGSAHSASVLALLLCSPVLHFLVRTLAPAMLEERSSLIRHRCANLLEGRIGTKDSLFLIRLISNRIN